MEMTAIKTVFGARSARVPISVVKSLVGESFSAGGALQLAEAVGALVSQQLPPTIDWEREEPTQEPAYGLKPARSARLQTVLVQAVGLMGVSSAVVIRTVPGHG